jgi:hypothetical protein
MAINTFCRVRIAAATLFVPIAKYSPLGENIPALIGELSSILQISVKLL